MEWTQALFAQPLEVSVRQRMDYLHRIANRRDFGDRDRVQTITPAPRSIPGYGLSASQVEADWSAAKPRLRRSSPELWSSIVPRLTAWLRHGPALAVANVQR